MTAIIDSDTIELMAKKKNTIILERGKTPKEMVLISATAIDTVTLVPKWSEAYYLNIFCSAGIGCLIDYKTPKIWKYPSNINLTETWIEKNNTSYLHDHVKYAHKGAVNLRISLPHINLFYSAYETEKKSRLGFMGLSIGLDYYYNDKTYLNLSGSAIMDFPAPIPVPIDRSGVWNDLFSIYGSISNNHMFIKNRLSIGYGVSFGRDWWNTKDHGSFSRDKEKVEELESTYRNSNSLGFVFPVYYYTKRSFYMGVVYRPMFLQFADKTRFKYQHTISIDLGWRIRLSKR